jgi:agmatinase
MTTEHTPAVSFHGEDVLPSPPDLALFHVIPAPYEKSVSYGTGTADGPQAILDASCQLELFDGKSIPADFGIHTLPMLDCSGSHEEALARVEAAVAACVSLDKIPVVLGGEHTITYGAIRALRQKHSDFGVVQFDAHADLRETYEGSPFSHACVMKRIFDLGIPLLQLGTRSYSFAEHNLRQKHCIEHANAEDIFLMDINEFVLPVGFPEKVYITFDIDGLDPSIMPATGTPVPGGLSWYQAICLLELIIGRHICIGFDVVELAPIPYLHSASFTAAQLVYNIMGYLSRSHINRKYRGLSAEETRSILKA